MNKAKSLPPGPIVWQKCAGPCGQEWGKKVFTYIEPVMGLTVTSDKCHYCRGEVKMFHPETGKWVPYIECKNTGHFPCEVVKDKDGGCCCVSEDNYYLVEGKKLCEACFQKLLKQGQRLYRELHETKP